MHKIEKMCIGSIGRVRLEPTARGRGRNHAAAVGEPVADEMPARNVAHPGLRWTDWIGGRLDLGPARWVTRLRALQRVSGCGWASWASTLAVVMMEITGVSDPYNCRLPDPGEGALRLGLCGHGNIGLSTRCMSARRRSRRSLHDPPLITQCSRSIPFPNGLRRSRQRAARNSAIVCPCTQTYFAVMTNSHGNQTMFKEPKDHKVPA